MNEIPELTDPLGRYWEQPTYIRDVEMDRTHVLLSQADIALLHKYDTSFPTGVYPGKVWLRREKARTLLVWYGPENAEKACPILFREVLVID